MVTELTRDQIIELWFAESDIDLKCAKILYENNLYSRALYHLQQSNEKLAKGLLLSIGILSIKKVQNQKIKAIIGFIPKEPHFYNHRTLPFFVSDMSSASPALERIANSIDWTGAQDIFEEFQVMLKNSKKGNRQAQEKAFYINLFKRPTPN